MWQERRVIRLGLSFFCSFLKSFRSFTLFRLQIVLSRGSTEPAAAMYMLKNFPSQDSLTYPWCHCHVSRIWNSSTVDVSWRANDAQQRNTIVIIASSDGCPRRRDTTVCGSKSRPRLLRIMKLPFLSLASIPPLMMALQVLAPEAAFPGSASSFCSFSRPHELLSFSLVSEYYPR